MSDTTTSPAPSGLDDVRSAYQELAEGEKAKIMRFTARHRFTDDNFENWLSESGLLHGDLRREMIAERQLPTVRDKLDSSLLANQGLMRDTITKYLAQGNAELLQNIVEWVRQEKGRLAPNPPNTVIEVVKDNNAPESLSNHPQYELACAVLNAHWLDHKLVELAGAEPPAEEDEPAAEVAETPAETSEPANGENSGSFLSGLGLGGLGAAAGAAGAALLGKDEDDSALEDDFDPVPNDFAAEPEPISAEEPVSVALDREAGTDVLPEVAAAGSSALMNKIESLQAYCDELQARVDDMRRASKDVAVLGVLKPATEAFTLIEEIHQEASGSGEIPSWNSVEELKAFASGDAPAAPAASASAGSSESFSAKSTPLEPETPLPEVSSTDLGTQADSAPLTTEPAEAAPLETITTVQSEPQPEQPREEPKGLFNKFM